LQDLTTLNVKIDSIALLNGLKLTDSVDIEKSIPDAKTSLDIKSLRLDISIPQAALYNRARGYIPQSQWDQGINALFLNYNLAGNKA
ncbi:FimD/PapC N-terminal domain-containing protein, partial [Klebsiella oxytoca]